MVSKSKQAFLLSIYYLSPVIASIIYWFEEPDAEPDMLLNLSHKAGNIFGIFSFIWLCFNIIMMLKIKLVEKNFKLTGLVKFHTIMSTVGLIFVLAHYPLLRFAAPAWESIRETNPLQITTGNITMVTFFFLMLLAFIFMTNRLVKYKKIGKLRVSVFKKNFKYNINKALHNLTIVAVFASLIHTLISDISLLMRGIYIFLFGITFIGWVYHKFIRRIRSDSDPFVYRKASWDLSVEEVTTEKNNELAFKLIEKNPSLYPCFQCGVCTESCPIAKVSEGRYNPRRLILDVLLGFEKKIFGQENSFKIWGCTKCDLCDIVCPQKVEPTKIFTTLKNMSAERGEAPSLYYIQIERILACGKAIPTQPAIERRREELNLPSILEPEVDEIKKLLSSPKFSSNLSRP